MLNDGWQRVPLSAVVITLNAASQLKDCLSSLQFADEILIVDAGSTDSTLEIARTMGASIYTHPWQGFGPQKRYAVSQAKNDWVLCLDADERVSTDLQSALSLALEKPLFHAYETPRTNYFMGRSLRHGEGYPDWSLRLFDRRFAMWSNDAVHEKVVTHETVGRLRCREGLLHHSALSLSGYLDKQNSYTSLQAEELFAKGAKPTYLRLLVSPALRFLKFYVVRGGFLDGVPGLVHVTIGCFNSFIKYAKLFALQRKDL